MNLGLKLKPILLWMRRLLLLVMDGWYLAVTDDVDLCVCGIAGSILVKNNWSQIIWYVIVSSNWNLKHCTVNDFWSARQCLLELIHIFNTDCSVVLQMNNWYLFIWFRKVYIFLWIRFIKLFWYQWLCSIFSATYCYQFGDEQFHVFEIAIINVKMSVVLNLWKSDGEVRIFEKICMLYFYPLITVE